MENKILSKEILRKEIELVKLEKQVENLKVEISDLYEQLNAENCDSKKITVATAINSFKYDNNPTLTKRYRSQVFTFISKCWNLQPNADLRALNNVHLNDVKNHHACGPVVAAILNELCNHYNIHFINDLDEFNSTPSELKSYTNAFIKIKNKITFS